MKIEIVFFSFFDFVRILEKVPLKIGSKSISDRWISFEANE